MISPITVEQAVAYLNELVALDKPAVAALIANRVPCNEELSDHPTAQVDVQHGGFLIGLLGVINGLFGVDEHGRGPIYCVFKKGNLEGFYVVKYTPAITLEYVDSTGFAVTELRCD